MVVALTFVRGRLRKRSWRIFAPPVVARSGARLVFVVVTDNDYLADEISPRLASLTLNQCKRQLQFILHAA